MRKSASGWPGWRILWPRNDLAPLLRWCSQCSAGYSKSRYFCFSNNFSKLGPISLRCDILVKLESVFTIYATPQVKTRFDWIRSTLINRSIVCILLSWHRDKENDSYKSDRLKALYTTPTTADKMTHTAVPVRIAWSTRRVVENIRMIRRSAGTLSPTETNDRTDSASQTVS